MSNYMFMLENHLTAAQNRALSGVQSVAAEAGVNLFLGGGAMRDMIGGFPIRDLDFIVEGNAIKLARSMEERGLAAVVSLDELFRDAELLLSGRVTAQLSTSRQERYAKPGGKPQVTPAPIYDHLRARDFSVNAMALSLSKASLGLLFDPTNGLGDLEHRELRAITNHTLFDQPVRLFRLLRLKVRLGSQIAEKTRQQYENALEAGVQKLVTPQALLGELRRAASEPNPAEVLQEWDRAGLLAAVLPGLSGSKLNVAGLQRLQKARQVVPFGSDIAVDDLILLLHAVSEKLTPKERTELAQRLHLEKSTVDKWQKLEARARKLEKQLSSSGIHKASEIYRTIAGVPGEETVFLMMKSAHRTVHDRIRNFFQKYLPAAQEISDQQVEEAGGKPGTPKFEKLKAEMIAKRLDSRPKRIVEPPPVVAPPPSPRPRFSSRVT